MFEGPSLKQIIKKLFGRWESDFKVNLKIYDVTTWLANNYNTHIEQKYADINLETPCGLGLD